MENQLRLIESEFFLLSQKYGVKSVQEFDTLVQTGKLHEVEAFEDFFKLDHLENERDKVLRALEAVK